MTAIYHQYRSTYVFADVHNGETRDAAARALKAIGITEFERVAWEPLHFDTTSTEGAYLSYGHHPEAERVYAYRFVNVVRPEGMKKEGWH